MNAILFQQPSELPQPKPSSPEQQFGNYSLESFVVENWPYLCIVLFILLIFLIYSWNLRKERKKREEN